MHQKPFFRETKHNFTELSQKTESQYIPKLVLNTRAILVVLVHFTEKLNHQKNLTERLLTKKPVGRSPFGRTRFDQKII
jgi:hypothetical protein